MSSDFVLATALLLTGDVKLLAFRSLSSARHASVIYPEAEVGIVREYQGLKAPEVWRALDRLMKGDDGLECLVLEYGQKGPEEIFHAYSE